MTHLRHDWKVTVGSGVVAYCDIRNCREKLDWDEVERRVNKHDKLMGAVRNLEARNRHIYRDEGREPWRCTLCLKEWVMGSPPIHESDCVFSVLKEVDDV